MNTDGFHSICVQQRTSMVNCVASLLLIVGIFSPKLLLADGVVVDEDRVAAAGIIKRSGRHISLYTDDRDRKDLGELIQVFDLAAGQWCAYFDLKKSVVSDWHVQAFLMADDSKFVKAGLIPDDLPKFAAGYAINGDIWFYPQPGNYYTRHLLLHEGTHLFMNKFLGNFGPPWYSEGMAEWLGLHRWDKETNKLQLRYQVKDRREADYWGRVKIVREELAAGNGMTLQDVFSIEPNAFQDVRYYGWGWAACEFLAHHPLTKKNFVRLKRHVHEPAHMFRRKALTKLNRKEEAQLNRDWNLFIHEIDYGYDVARGAVSKAKTINEPLASAPNAARFQIDADRSWQSTGIQLQEGDEVSISARGRYQVKMTDRPWPCEAGGITLRYYQGQPLGMLMAAVVPDADHKADVNQPLVSSQPVGYQSTMIASQNGELCFRINESPAHLADNLDGLEVTVDKLK